jgi:hypothetical protein
LGGIISMGVLKLLTAAVLAPLCLSGYATAAEMTGAEIKDLLAGKTIYVETTSASAVGSSGQSIIYFAADNTALFKNPKGMWHGAWTLKDNALCIDWKEAPNTPCRKYDKQGGVISVIDAGTGLVIAKIVKSAPGNSEKLAP